MNSEAGGIGGPGASRVAGGLGALVAASEIIVCTGSGGVGKTSVAAAMAVQAAHGGRRAAVVTIDPARRLADALGLRELSNEPREVRGAWPGSLWAMMLDAPSTFDALVARYATSPAQTSRILANRFYRNIADDLSGTQEYMATEKLYELHASGRFDLIVVDTPPTRNALDFLEAPDQLARLLDHRVYRVLTTGGRGVSRVVNRAAQALVRTVGRVIGAGVLEDAVAFFAAFEGMEEGFRARSAHLRELLRSPRCAFVLVAAPRADTAVEAHHFATALRARGIAVRALVVNRATPRFTNVATERLRRQAAERAGTPYGALLANLADFASAADQEHAHIARLAALVAGTDDGETTGGAGFGGENATGSAGVGDDPGSAEVGGENATRSADVRAAGQLVPGPTVPRPVPVVVVPLLRTDVADLATLDQLGAHLLADTGR